MQDQFRDLAPLDPRHDPERWERMVAGTLRRAAPELQRRALAPSPGLLLLLSGWTRPALSAAAGLAAVAAALLLVLGRAPAERVATPPGVADALGYPSPVATWLETGVSPSVEEMVVSLEGDTP